MKRTLREPEGYHLYHISEKLRAERLLAAGSEEWDLPPLARVSWQQQALPGAVLSARGLQVTSNSQEPLLIKKQLSHVQPTAELCIRALKQHSGLLHPAPSLRCCLQQQCADRNGACMWLLVLQTACSPRPH